MGCIHSPKIIIIHSIELSEREKRENLSQGKSKYPADINYTLSVVQEEEDDNTSNFSLEKSQISIIAKIKEHDLIFL